MAARASENRAAEALQHLCVTYWYPLFSFARLTLGLTSHEAEDLTQGFFEHLLRRRVFASVERNCGNFRNFLLVCFRNFHASGLARTRAVKRGGAYEAISIDLPLAEKRLALQQEGKAPGHAYDRAWALEVLNDAYRRTEIHYSAQGKLDLFQSCRPFLENPSAQPYTQLATALGKTEAAVKTEVYRLRRVFSEAFRSIVAQTAGSTAEIEQEVRYLVEMLTD